MAKRAAPEIVQPSLFDHYEPVQIDLFEHCGVELPLASGPNLLIQGDNLAALRSLDSEHKRGYPRLQRSKAGQDSGRMRGFDAPESANYPRL